MQLQLNSNLKIHVKQNSIHKNSHSTITFTAPGLQFGVLVTESLAQHDI